MRKILLTVLAVALFAAAQAGAQVSVEQRFVRPGASVALWNETPVPLLIFVDGSCIGSVGPGESLTQRFGGGVWPFYQDGYSRLFILSVRVCKELSPVRFAVPPPSWATDRERFGESAILPDDSGGTEALINSKVSGIEKALEKERGLDRRRMRAELRGWFAEARKTGIGNRCVGPLIVAGEVNVQTYGSGGYGYSRSSSIMFVVRESGGEYEIERAGNGNSW